MDHLACFAAGMYGLAAHEEKDDNSERWMEIAKVTLMIRLITLAHYDLILICNFICMKIFMIHFQTLGNLALDGGWIAFSVVLIILVVILLVYCKKKGMFKDINLNCL